MSTTVVDERDLERFQQLPGETEEDKNKRVRRMFDFADQFKQTVTSSPVASQKINNEYTIIAILNYGSNDELQLLLNVLITIYPETYQTLNLTDRKARDAFKSKVKADANLLPILENPVDNLLKKLDQGGAKKKTKRRRKSMNRSIRRKAKNKKTTSR